MNRDGGRVLDAGPVFGVTDPQNGDDLAGDVAASRRFDVAGATDLAAATPEDRDPVVARTDTEMEGPDDAARVRRAVADAFAELGVAVS